MYSRLRPLYPIKQKRLQPLLTENETGPLISFVLCQSKTAIRCVAFQDDQEAAQTTLKTALSFVCAFYTPFQSLDTHTFCMAEEIHLDKLPAVLEIKRLMYAGFHFQELLTTVVKHLFGCVAN